VHNRHDDLTFRLPITGDMTRIYLDVSYDDRLAGNEGIRANALAGLGTNVLTSWLSPKRAEKKTLLLFVSFAGE
jgi:hypothetical protein